MQRRITKDAVDRINFHNNKPFFSDFVREVPCYPIENSGAVNKVYRVVFPDLTLTRRPATPPPIVTTVSC